MKALITGASSGIGRDMAKILGDMGYDLILVGRNRRRLEETSEAVKTPSTIYECDLSDENACFELYQNFRSENIDVLINNAGFGLIGEFYESDLNTELDMIKTNVSAVHILTKLFLQDFIEKNSGYILNVSSAAAFQPGPLMATYYSTKAYVLRLTQAVYEELRRRNSRVYIGALCPGPVDTNFNNTANVRFALKGLPSEYVASYAIAKMFKRKLTIIPGITMKLSHLFERFLPDKILLRITYHFQHKKSNR